MAYHPVSTFQFLVGPDKATEQKRYDRGVKITSQAPGSPLYNQYTDLRTAADEVIKGTVFLKDAMDAYTVAEAAFTMARTALASTVVQWDGAYGVFVYTGQKYAATLSDVASIGAEARGTTINPLVMPISVGLTWNAKRDNLRIHVERAPGMSAVTVEVSQNPADPSSWHELDGNGALHLIPHPAKGTWWARAQSRTAKGKSDFTTPVSVIVT